MQPHRPPLPAARLAPQHGGGGDCLGPGPRGGGGLELESSLRHIRRKKGRETNAVPGEGQRGSGWP